MVVVALFVHVMLGQRVLSYSRGSHCVFLVELCMFSYCVFFVVKLLYFGHVIGHVLVCSLWV